MSYRIGSYKYLLCGDTLTLRLLSLKLYTEINHEANFKFSRLKDIIPVILNKIGNYCCIYNPYILNCCVWQPEYNSN